MRELLGQQGEVRIIKIDELPDMKSQKAEKTTKGDWIISHSESGNHHVVGSGCDVMERVDNVPPGMKILYAIVKNPDSLRQDAGSNPHEAQSLPAGLYEFRISREYDPFAEQARIVAD